MRRKDREVTDSSQIRAVLNKCTHCRLGLYDGEEVYIVPMNFGWTEENGAYALYFHCASEGRKLDILRQNPKAAFQMDTDFTLRPAEKRLGLAAVMDHTAGAGAWSFPEASVNRVTVLRLTVEKLSCKMAKC